MASRRVDTLKVPGGILHYEVQGSGPVLLIIPGMPADAGFYSVLARQLADTYTVVAYDPRGISRSRLDGPPEEQRVEVHADDAHRILDTVAAGPAHVLTDSISGLVGLQLAASEPGQVHTLVAFEPPVIELLADRERWRAFIEELHDTYQREGVGAAGQKFGEAVGLTGGGEPDESEPQGEPDPEVMAAMARMGENMTRQPCRPRGLPAALAQPPGDHHLVALAQGLGAVVGRTGPSRARWRRSGAVGRPGTPCSGPPWPPARP